MSPPEPVTPGRTRKDCVGDRGQQALGTFWVPLGGPNPRGAPRIFPTHHPLWPSQVCSQVHTKAGEFFFFLKNSKEKVQTRSRKKKKQLVKPKHGAAGMLWVLAEAANFWVMGVKTSRSESRRCCGWILQAHPICYSSKYLPKKAATRYVTLG